MKWSVSENFWDCLYYANEFTVYSYNNPLSYVMSTAKVNATGMRWVPELADFNFKVKYRPGKSSRNWLLRNPVEDKCSSYTEETDINSISNVENNWLTVTAKQPEVLETYLNLKPDKELIKIDCETLWNNLMIELFHLFSKLFHHKTDPVLKIKNQCVGKAKLF